MKKAHLFSLIPFGIFVAFAIGLSFVGGVNISLLIAVGILAILIGAFLHRDSQAYWQTIFDYFGSRTAMTAVLLWLIVGVYGNILKDGHLVDGLVWAASQWGVGPSSFTLIVFLFSALFAFSTGTGFGTISAMSLTLFPAGVTLGAAPALLGGAILSGASFGDSISPISDTAIIAASTQEYPQQERLADIAGSIRHRLPLVAIAFLLAGTAFAIASFSSTAGTSVSVSLSDEASKGLLLLLPTFIIILLSFFGINIFLTLFVGILTSIVLGFGFHLFDTQQIDCVCNGQVFDAIVNGISGMTDICILLMVVVSLSGIFIRSGCMDAIVEYLTTKVCPTVRGAELLILMLVALSGILVAAVNTIANICVAPFVNSIGLRYDLHPYRRTTLLSTVVCTFPFVLPYGGCALLLQKGVEASGCNIELQTTDIFLTAFYPWALLLVIFIATLIKNKRKILCTGLPI